MRNFITIAGLMCSLAVSQEYPWPCQPVNQQHWINGTFCECREGSSGDRDHFHDGVDIDLPQGNPVYSVVNGTVTSIGSEATYGINAWIRVGRYAYVHVNHNPALSVGSAVTAGETVIGWTNAWNHIHFKDGYPGNEINAIRLNGGLTPLSDAYDPTVANIKFYIDGTTTEFQNNRVFGTIDIVSRAYDRTDSGPLGNNNGIYKIGYDIIDSVGNQVYGPVIPFEFSSIPSSDSYITNVYALGSNTSNYRYTVTNNLGSNGALNLNNWPLGSYTARVFTWDQYLHSDTLLQPFQVVVSDDAPPDPPQLLALVQENEGFHLSWLANTEADLLGYRLYFSYNNQQWYNNINESQLDANTTDFVTTSFSNELIYIRLTAVDNGPFQNESDFSTTFVFRKSNIDKKILFVNSGWNNNDTGLPGYAQAMDPFVNFGFETISDTLLTPDTVSIYSEYPVAWITTGWSQKTIDPDLAGWIRDRALYSNRKSVISGLFAAQALEADSNGIQFLSGFGIDSTTVMLFNGRQITGAGFLSSLGTFTLPNTSDSLVAGFHGPEASPLLRLDTTLSIGWLNQDGNGVLLSLSPEMIPDLSLFAEASLNYLFPGWVSADPENLLPNDFSVTAYPNPFNHVLSLRLQGAPGNYDLTGWDLRGSVVFHRNILISESGSASVRLQSEFSTLSSGVYFLRLVPKSAYSTNITKVLLVK